MKTSAKDVPIETIELTRGLLSMAIRIKTGLSPLKTDSDKYFDELSKDIIYRTKVFIWQQELDKKTIKYPKDWWEAFKERWFPRWLKKRYPIKCQYYVFEPKYYFPKLTLPDEDHVFKNGLRIFIAE